MFPEFQDGKWVVSVVLPGQSAERAGLLPGDVLVSVDGAPFTAETTAAETTLLIRGPVGEPAHIVVNRDGRELTFAPVREERVVVGDARLVDGDIAYFAQYTFTANAPEVVATTLQTLLAQNPTALIWDLRSNGGGSMEATQQVLSYFFDDGVLFLAQLKEDRQRTFAVTGEAIAPDIPLVLLIGQRTYSSAETAAATVSERGRGTLIGNVTHGKGTIQDAVHLVDGSVLQYTVAYWLGPTGGWYEGVGVKPDFVIDNDPATEVDEVLQFAIRYLRGGE